MTFDSVLLIQDMPFCLGAMETPHNPNGLPTVYPFRLEVNHKLSRLEQVDDPILSELLSRSYMVGSEMGTASDSTELGKPYVDEFTGFISKYAKPNGDLLEIGGGTGFLSRLLMEAGWRVTVLEPGKGYETHWKRHGISVINDFFPSENISGTFDVIVFYTVLEHIKDTRSFLLNVKKHLKPTGTIFLGVPNCSIEIQCGDPSMLLHEHYQYFTPCALRNTLLDAGFEAKVEESVHGRTLFATGQLSQIGSASLLKDKSELTALQEYLKKVITVRKILKVKLLSLLSSGSIGIFCPSRMLNYLDADWNYRFYDDDANLQGKFYPPFCSKIMGRDDLLADPPNTTFVASRTFGSRIKRELIAQGLSANVISLEEVLPQ